MLDRLPPELLDDILLLAVRGPKDDRQRLRDQARLAQLCLTSSYVAQRVQPLLFRDVLIDRASTCDAFERTLRERPGLAAGLNTARLRFDEEPQVPPLLLGRGCDLFALLPNLRAVFLSKFVEEPVDLSCLAAIPHLEHLVLELVLLEEVPSTITFPSLRSLSLTAITSTALPHPAGGALLNPTLFPSLRALAMSANVPPSIASLGPLDVLQVRATSDLLDLTRLRRIPQINVVSLPLDPVQVSRRLLPHLPPVHWRFLPPSAGGHAFASYDTCFDALDGHLAATPTPPRSFHLPRSLDKLPRQAWDACGAALEQCLVTARLRGVEVGWHDEEREEGASWRLSQSCWRYVKERKAREAAEQGKGWEGRPAR